MKHIRSLAIVGALFAVTSPAHAQSWYVLDPPRMQCADAASFARGKNFPGAVTPQTFETTARVMGAWVQTQNFDGRGIVAVTADWPNGRAVRMLYFARSASCNRYKTSKEHVGALR